MYTGSGCTWWLMTLMLSFSLNSSSRSSFGSHLSHVQVWWRDLTRCAKASFHSYRWTSFSITPANTSRKHLERLLGLGCHCRQVAPGAVRYSCQQRSEESPHPCLHPKFFGARQGAAVLTHGSALELSRQLLDVRGEGDCHSKWYTCHSNGSGRFVVILRVQLMLSGMMWCIYLHLLPSWSAVLRAYFHF